MFVVVFACIALGVLGATVDTDIRTSCPVGWLDEGKWEWISSGMPIKDFIWSSKQPEWETMQNCLDLEYTNYLAHDTSCNNLYFPICQFLV